MYALTLSQCMKFQASRCLSSGSLPPHGGMGGFQSYHPKNITPHSAHKLAHTNTHMHAHTHTYTSRQTNACISFCCCCSPFSLHHITVSAHNRHRVASRCCTNTLALLFVALLSYFLLPVWTENLHADITLHQVGPTAESAGCKYRHVTNVYIKKRRIFVHRCEQKSSSRYLQNQARSLIVSSGIML